MSKRKHLKLLNAEIQKLNGIIDHKIIHHYNYKREASQHKTLLRQIRKEERARSLVSTLSLDIFSRA